MSTPTDLLAMAVGLLILCGLAAWYVLAAPSSQVLCPAISSGSRKDNRIALTFDDGPGSETGQVLDILLRENVRATFFLCGANAERDPEMVRRMQREGHCIGNHAYSHRRFPGKSAEWIRHEISSTQRVLDSLIPSPAQNEQKPLRLFRPPYGLRWFGLGEISKELDQTVVLWDVNSQDWKRAPRDILARVVAKTRAGSIILMHDGIPPNETNGRSNTVQALPQIIRTLSSKYRFVTIPELANEEASLPSPVRTTVTG